MTEPKKQNLKEQPVHLGLGAKVIPQPTFTGMAWYGDYMKRTEADGFEGRLVSMYTFDSSWTSWEQHPNGEELVVCIAGEIVLTQELNGVESKITLLEGEYTVNPPGVWHTADVKGKATALFITSGFGTEHRPR